MQKIMYVSQVVCAVCCVVGVVLAQHEFYSDSRRSIEIENVGQEDEDCFVYGDRSKMMEMFLNKNVNVSIVSSAELDALINKCHNKNRNITAEEHAKKVIRKKRNIIFPGTKWCGTGNISAHYNELGEYAETDKCCREHDHCPDYVLPWDYIGDLKNWAVWSKFSCTCDDKFWTCLKAVGDETASAKVGHIFFDVLCINCYRPVTKIKKTCVRRSWWFNICQQYTETKVQGYQWRAALSFQ